MKGVNFPHVCSMIECEFFLHPTDGNDGLVFTERLKRKKDISDLKHLLWSSKCTTLKITFVYVL